MINLDFKANMSKKKLKLLKLFILYKLITEVITTLVLSLLLIIKPE